MNTYILAVAFTDGVEIVHVSLEEIQADNLAEALDILHSQHPYDNYSVYGHREIKPASFNVVMRHGIFGNVDLDGITEIHMGYSDGKIAFESDIHSTGNTYDTKNILEFEAKVS